MEFVKVFHILYMLHMYSTILFRRRIGETHISHNRSSMCSMKFKGETVKHIGEGRWVHQGQATRHAVPI